MLNPLYLGSSLLGVPFVVYGIYGLATILTTEKKYSMKTKDLPKITVCCPAWNEEKVIDMKIKNLVNLDYPKELLEVIVVDDNSSDKTSEECLKAFKKYKIKGQVIKNKSRKGTNYNYNLGVKTAKTKIVLTTDADVVFEKKAIKEALKVLLSSEKVGAVCGELKPIIDKKTIATSTEAPYRNVYGKMCSWESNLESSYCFNGPLILLKKKAFSPIDTKRGASDASCALNIIKKGYQTKYVPKSKFSELIANTLSEQKRQKIRRATRLLQCTWDSKNLLFRKGWFGSFVFPLRMIMFMISPLLFFIGSISLVGLLFQINLILGSLALLFALSLIFLGLVKDNFLSSFIWHQYYLLAGLIKMFKPNYLWKPIERKELK
jgi:poly-beta-1,6-N-acetyl-D-glucosamine synthase